MGGRRGHGGGADARHRSLPRGFVVAREWRSPGFGPFVRLPGPRRGPVAYLDEGFLPVTVAGPRRSLTGFRTIHLRVAARSCAQRGTWYVVRGTWYVVRGTWYVVRGERS